MISLKFCPDCGKCLPDPPFYCNWCGSCLNKTCLQCELVGFSKHCTQCGSEMLLAKVITKKSNNFAKINSNKPSTSSSSVISDSIVNQEKSSSKPQSNLRELVIKVKLLKGNEKKEVSLDNGGGMRHLLMFKSDSVEDVKKKIKDSYFGGESREANLGSFENYIATFLDFKKDYLVSSQFESLEKYFRENGLRPNQGASFYLHLLDRPKLLPNFNPTNTSASSLRHDVDETFKSIPEPQTNQSIHFFNKSNINRNLSKSNDIIEISNTFLLQTKPSDTSTSINKNNFKHQAELVNKNDSFPGSKSNRNIRLNASMPLNTNKTNLSHSAQPITTQSAVFSFKSNGSVTKVPSEKSLQKSTLFTKKDTQLNLTKDINSANTTTNHNKEVSSSSSDSDTDSSVSSTSSTRVHKKTVKRSNKEINNIKNQISGFSQVKKKKTNEPSKANTNQLIEPSIKKEQSEDIQSIAVQVQSVGNYEETLSVTPNVPTLHNCNAQYYHSNLSQVNFIKTVRSSTSQNEYHKRKYYNNNRGYTNESNYSGYRGNYRNFGRPSQHYDCRNYSENKNQNYKYSKYVPSNYQLRN